MAAKPHPKSACLLQRSLASRCLVLGADFLSIATRGQHAPNSVKRMDDNSLFIYFDFDRGLWRPFDDDVERLAGSEPIFTCPRFEYNRSGRLEAIRQAQIEPDRFVGGHCIPPRLGKQYEKDIGSLVSS
jgi:hypothetical protein